MNDHSYRSDIGHGPAATGFTMTGFLMGALFGAGLALLLAPASGGETRRRLGETARRVADAASEKLKRGGAPGPVTP